MNPELQQLQVFWKNTLSKAVELSNDPSNGLKPINPIQRAFASLAVLSDFEDNVAVIECESPRSESIIMNELNDALCLALEHLTGKKSALAVILNPDKESIAQEFVVPSQEALDSIGYESHTESEKEEEKSYREESAQEESIQESSASVQESSSVDEIHDYDSSGTIVHEITPLPSNPKDPELIIASDDEEEEYDSSAPFIDPVSEISDLAQVQANHVQRIASGKKEESDREGADPVTGIPFSKKHTFDTFVVGQSNRFTHAAALIAAEDPGEGFNPLFIWGGSGLGKTHLLHAVGHYAQQLRPNIRIRYVSSEEFTNDYINSMRDEKLVSFKRRYRNLDLLMVDDIQFLEGKESTQEEFFHTFNALHQVGSQIILSSDRPPKKLTTLTQRLRTRFEGGLITDIQPPDLETRIAILSKKAKIEGVELPHDVLELIATHAKSSIRELEGALIRVIAYSSMMNENTISDDVLKTALADFLSSEDTDVPVNPQRIIAVTADFFEIDTETLTGTSKIRKITYARQLAMYLCRELTDLSLPKIGEYFGGKDHSTVVYAARKVRKDMTKNPETYKEIQQITAAIKDQKYAIEP